MLKFIKREVNIYLDLETVESEAIPTPFYMYYIKDRDWFNPEKVINICNTGMDMYYPDWYEMEEKIGKGKMLAKTIFVVEWWNKRRNQNDLYDRKILYLKDKNFDTVPINKSFFDIHSLMRQRLHI